MKLDEFQYIWSLMRSNFSRMNAFQSTFHCSFLDAHLLKELIPHQDLENFSGMLYAHGLMIQVAHCSIRYPSRLIAYTEEKENTFPRVNGLLSTINTHICPAVLPTMLLYLDSSLIETHGSFTHSNRDRDREQKIWLNQSYIFDDAVINLSKDFEILKKIMLIDLNVEDAFRDSFERELLITTVTEISDLAFSQSLLNSIQETHLSLKEFIIARDDSSRVVNMQS
jgi:hypothetical protein